jgi:hypothetical protein
MERRNITLSLPEDVLRKARHLAVERRRSLSGLLADYMERIVDEDRRVAAAARRLERRLKKGMNLGTCGRAAWTRDDLHER